MHFPPRDIATDRLVNTPMLLYAYLQAGLIETGICLALYFWVGYIFLVTFWNINNLESHISISSPWMLSQL